MLTVELLNVIFKANIYTYVNDYRLKHIQLQPHHNKCVIPNVFKRA